MLYLSGFELNSRWVPLLSKGKLDLTKTSFLFLSGELYDK